MHYLIYISSATKLFSEKELKDILDTSRNNNEARDVTGLLLYHDGTILQILEGQAEVLDSLYQTITNDKRHTGVFKIGEGEMPRRQFGNWSMGFKQLSDKDWAEFSSYISLDPAKIRQLASVIDNKEMLTMINTFVTVNLSRN